MAYEIPGFKLGTLIAAADLSAAQYCFVGVDNAGKVALPTATGQVCVGVLQNKPTAGQVAEVMVTGVTFLKADGTGLTAGDKIEAVTTTGVAQVAAGAGTNIQGVALETAAAGAIFTALINCGAGYIHA